MQSKHLDTKQSLDYLFHPRSIAIVGVSTDMNRLGGGRGFLESLIDIGFKGKIYPVNREGGELLGCKIYPSIKDIPDSVDYVISAIPAQHTPQLLLDCASKGIKAVQIFSAGFSEIADIEGEKLESQLTAIARQKGIRIIGPNCMGLYCPRTGLAFFRELPKQSGSVGFISQSGGNSAHAIREGAMRGVYFSKAISYGNACDLSESDFLEYLAHDPETTVIAGYIEGVKEGARFLKAIKRAARAKPVIFYKAGATEQGIRAVASHTGTLAGSDRTWDSLLKQVDAIQVHSMEELIDVIVLFGHMSPLTGRNIALMGIGGGAIVQSADECANAGLNIPTLPVEIRQRLEEIYTSEAGASFRNPVDMYWRERGLIRKAVKIVADCDQIDLLMIQILVGVNSKKETVLLEQYLESILSLGKEIAHRTAVVLRLIDPARFWPFALEAQRALGEASFPVYPSASRAANAIAKFIEYYRRREMKLTTNQAGQGL